MNPAVASGAILYYKSNYQSTIISAKTQRKRNYNPCYSQQRQLWILAVAYHDYFESQLQPTAHMIPAVQHSSGILFVGYIADFEPSLLPYRDNSKAIGQIQILNFVRLLDLLNWHYLENHIRHYFAKKVKKEIALASKFGPHFKQIREK
jgi:hypothetical protein